MALAWLVPHETAAVLVQVLCTSYNHVPCHFMQSHICKVYACLAVTCHLHFWQNDRGLLHAAVVTRGWNGYRNKSQHRKLTLEKKILPPLQQGFKPATFQSRVWRSIPLIHQTGCYIRAEMRNVSTKKGMLFPHKTCSERSYIRDSVVD